jgi:hypothetical protein
MQLKAGSALSRFRYARTPCPTLVRSCRSMLARPRRSVRAQFWLPRHEPVALEDAQVQECLRSDAAKEKPRDIAAEGLVIGPRSGRCSQTHLALARACYCLHQARRQF